MQFSRSDELFLIHAAKAGNRDAMEALLKGHHSLILHVAGHFAGHDATRRETMEDLIQDARLAFMRAVQAFDTTRGLTLHTYARRAVQNRCQDDVRLYRHALSVPRHSNNLRVRLRKLNGQLAQDLGREPTLAELADRAEMPVERLQDVLTVRPCEPLDEARTVVDDHDARMSIFFRDHLLATCVASLSEREQYVVARLFGLGREEPATQTQVGREMNLSQVSVSRICQQALSRLREMIGDGASA